MSIKDTVNKILREVKPTKNFEDVRDIVEGGYLDSFEIMHLITILCDEFAVDITVDDIVPDNFNSVDAIVTMIDTLKSR